MRPVVIEPLVERHWPAVAQIYAEGIATGDATFETAVPDWAVWDEAHLPTCRFVAIAEHGVVGWAAVAPVSGRCVYGGVVEDSVYVAPTAAGRGIGFALLQHLVAATETEGIWTIQAGVFPENRASLRVHEKAGFQIVGVRTRLGQLAGVWRDVVLLERRSEVVT